MTSLYESSKRVLVTGGAGFPALRREGLKPAIIHFRDKLPK